VLDDPMSRRSLEGNANLLWQKRIAAVLEAMHPAETQPPCCTSGETLRHPKVAPGSDSILRLMVVVAQMKSRATSQGTFYRMRIKAASWFVLKAGSAKLVRGFSQSNQRLGTFSAQLRIGEASRGRARAFLGIDWSRIRKTKPYWLNLEPISSMLPSWEERGFRILP
jgi:hypothetical protein